MADVNKSVEITLRANLKQLQQSLESIPNITKKEAQQMTRALSAEFNKAQKAAKKAAEESKKAAQATSSAYEASSKKVGASFDKMATDAAASAQEIKISFGDAAEETGGLAEGAETLGTSMGAATLAVDKLIPGLDESAKKALEMADGLATAAEQAIKGGPATMALTAAVVAGTAAYQLFTAGSRAAAEQQKRLAEATEKATEKLDEQFNIVQSITGDFKDANREYQLLTGQITQLEFDLAQARDLSSEKTKRDLEIQDKRIKEQERLLVILDKAKASTASLSEQEKELLNQAMALSKSKEIQKGLDIESGAAAVRLVGFRSEIVKSIQRERDFANAIVERRQQVLQVEENTIRLKAEVAKEEKEEEARLQRLEKLEKARLENEQRLQQIQAKGQSLADQRIAAEDRSRQIVIASLDPYDEINAQTEERLRQNDLMQESIRKEVESAEKLAKNDADRQAAAEIRAEGERTIAALIEERQILEGEGELRLQELKDEIHDKRLENIEKEKRERQKQIDDEIKYISDLQQVTIGTFSNTLSTLSSISEATGNKNADVIKALFAAQRVAAVGEVAFNTAKAITAAQAYPPPFNGLMIASAVAAGAAQTASIFAQQAPKFHMGGMTPDESIAVVKAGEAVLDRATVNRLGGETGVNRLQNGQASSPQVIVTNPYKHFDRYMTDRQRAGLSARSAKRGY